jgi:hypothetical protein
MIEDIAKANIGNAIQKFTQLYQGCGCLGPLPDHCGRLAGQDPSRDHDGVKS